MSQPRPETREDLKRDIVRRISGGVLPFINAFLVLGWVSQFLQHAYSHTQYDNSLSILTMIIVPAFLALFHLSFLVLTVLNLNDRIRTHPRLKNHIKISRNFRIGLCNCMCVSLTGLCLFIGIHILRTRRSHLHSDMVAANLALFSTCMGIGLASAHFLGIGDLLLGCAWVLLVLLSLVLIISVEAGEKTIAGSIFASGIFHIVQHILHGVELERVNPTSESQRSQSQHQTQLQQLQQAHHGQQLQNNENHSLSNSQSFAQPQTFTHAHIPTVHMDIVKDVCAMVHVLEQSAKEVCIWVCALNNELQKMAAATQELQSQVQLQGGGSGPLQQQLQTSAQFSGVHQQQLVQQQQQLGPLRLIDTESVASRSQNHSANTQQPQTDATPNVNMLPLTQGNLARNYLQAMQTGTAPSHLFTENNTTSYAPSIATTADVMHNNRGGDNELVHMLSDSYSHPRTNPSLAAGTRHHPQVQTIDQLMNKQSWSHNFGRLNEIIQLCQAVNASLPQTTETG